MNDEIVIEHIKSVGSTNAELKRRILNGSVTKACALRADEQTAGRGRRGRTWLSLDGALMISIALPIDGMKERTVMLISLAVSLGVKHALTQNGVDASVKWPNDIVVAERNGYKKLCGILCEIVFASEQNKSFVIVGIGINANCEAIPDALLQPATSVFLETGRLIELDELARDVVNSVMERIERLDGAEDALIHEYEEQCITLDRAVCVSNDRGECIYGTAKSINGDGRLIVLTDGEELIVSAADVSVRF